MEDLYQTSVKEFFDEMEVYINEIKKKKKTLSIVKASIFGAIIISFYIFIEFDTFGPVLIVLLIAEIISMILSSKQSNKRRLLISDYESRFYDDVFINIIASELNGTGKSVSFFDASFEKQSAYPGCILSSRDVEITGTVNGNKFTYVQSSEDIITKVVKSNGVVTDYSHSKTTSDISLDFETRKKALSPIKLIPLEKREKYGKYETVRMDNKYFTFHVECNDELSAYKYLTADVMEGIEAWKNSSNICNITFDESTGNVIYSCYIDGIDMDYKPSFSKNMEKNRQNYRSDLVLKEAMKSVHNIQVLMQGIPKCIA